MKILVIQLARLGDIYLSWPAIRALRRKHPQAQIEVVTRPRFASAFEGLSSVDKIHLLSAKDLLGPMFQEHPDINASFNKVSEFVDNLKNQNYDWILNFSFSPSSSYLTHALTTDQAKVCGYTRYEDGFLNIPDDMSAYFYAQVGLGRSNRFHLAEIFGTMAESDLEDSDWATPVLNQTKNLDIPDRAIVIHIGASEQRKAVSPHKWGAIVSHLRKQTDNPILLVGSENEKAIAETIMAGVPGDGVTNLVGKTTLPDMFHILTQSSLLIGCDSAPIHMASFTKTPTLNLSFSTVNFWETGPRSPQSFILKTQSEDEMASDKIALIARQILLGEKTELAVVTTQKGFPCYRAFSNKEQEAQWQLVQAIYQGTPFPEMEDPIFLDGISKLQEINQLMIDQMEFIHRGGDITKVAGIINRGEEIIGAILNLVPSLGILIRWYQTEKIRIGPGETSEVLAKTLHIHKLMKQVLEIYQPVEMESVKEVL